MKGKPLRLEKYLTSKELMKELRLSRPTFYRWVNEGKFGELIKLDPHGGYYYADPQDLPKLQAIVGV